jgi:hypothetical protein
MAETTKEQEQPSMRRAKAYSCGVKADTLYDHLSKDRENVIQTARDLAQITIPSVFPPEGYKVGDNIGENNQSANAMCVNTLASKLMFMALPPDRPVLRFQPIEHKLQKEMAADPRMWTMVEAGLARLELEHRKRLEATTTRSAYVGATKQLIIAGNVCWEALDLEHPIYHPMTCYVVKRNSKGEQLLVIVKRKVDIMDLDDDIQDMIFRLKPALNTGKEWEQQADIYCVCKRVKDPGEPSGFKWEYWEEFEGELIPGTEFDADYEAPPLFAAWMIPVYGQNWGRSYCEEYRGDLKAIENFSAAIGDGAAAASLILLFLSPGARTSAKAIRDAENMELFVGKAEDLSMFKSEKQQDFAFINNVLEKSIQRLGRAFLLVSSVQRAAERVTAEEWRKMAREIDEAMGGTYSELAQSFQRLVVNRFVVLHNEDDPQLPKLPPGIFRVAVITGIEAMGRSIEGESLVRATGTAVELTKGAALERIDIGVLTERIFISEGVQTAGLLMNEEQVQGQREQAKQEMTQQTLLEKGAGPAAQAMGKMGAEGMSQMMAQQAQAGGAPEETPTGVQPQ